MMTLNETHELEAVLDVAKRMCVAARTAPKARGSDNLVTAIVTDGPEKERLAETMLAIAAADEKAGLFARDAQGLRDAHACVLLGTKLQRLGIPACNNCGYEGCRANAAAGGRCAYNIGDLGIALGSAASIAADNRVDNRIMYTVGLAAVRVGLLGQDVALAYAIVLSARGKNIFFDRK